MKRYRIYSNLGINHKNQNKKNQKNKFDNRVYPKPTELRSFMAGISFTQLFFETSLIFVIIAIRNRISETNKKSTGLKHKHTILFHFSTISGRRINMNKLYRPYINSRKVRP